MALFSRRYVMGREKTLANGIASALNCFRKASTPKVTGEQVVAAFPIYNEKIVSDVHRDLAISLAYTAFIMPLYAFLSFGHALSLAETGLQDTMKVASFTSWSLVGIWMGWSRQDKIDKIRKQVLAGPPIN